MKKETIWEYFGVKPKNPDQVSVVGIDFGAGELTACLATLRYGELRLEDLAVDNYNTRWAYTAFNDEHKIIGEEVVKYPEEIYTNFKKNPEAAIENYGAKLEGGLTYQYLMEKTFFCLVRNLLKNKIILGDCRGQEEKEIFLFVGRPSSNAWESQAKEYQNILQRGLHELESKTWELEPGTKVKVKLSVIVYSEAEAAMASEYYREDLDAKETIVVIDGGSSTFDCVVVKDGRVLCEYSRQVGAGMIEKNMFDICLLELDKQKEKAGISVDQRKAEHDEKVAMIDFNEGVHTIELRKRKEDYFGPDGNRAYDDNRYSIYMNSSRKRWDIDHAFMDLAIKKMPVRVERSYLDEEDKFGGNDTQDYTSFWQAIQAFVKGAKARCIDEKTGEEWKIDRMILTGGATVMPFVQEIIREVFQVEQNQIKLERPSLVRRFSVSRGLAYMGYVELKKYQELIRMEQSMHKKLESLREKISAQVRTTCKEEIWKEVYIKQIEQWVEDPSMKTLHDWIQMTYHIPIDIVRNDLGELMRREGVIKEMNQTLEENFHKLFPKADCEYHYKIEQEDILTAFEGELKQIQIYLFDLLDIRQKVRNLFVFLGAKEIRWHTKLSISEKKGIQNHIKEHKNEILNKLGAQIESKTQEAVIRIYETMIQNMNRSLEIYIEGLTPYFVRSAADVKNGRN